MKSHAFDVYRPKSWSEAFDILSRSTGQAAPLIFYPKPTALQNIGVHTLLDLSLLDLDFIKESASDMVHIGALTPLQKIVESPILAKKSGGLLPLAATLVASLGIRNLANLAGAIQANSGPPEILLALIALQAQVTLRGAGESKRVIALAEYLVVRQDANTGNEILVEAQFQSLAQKGTGVALERVARTPRDEAIVAAAAVLEEWEGVISRASLAVAGASPTPVKIEAAEHILTDQRFSEWAVEKVVESVMQSCNPITDYRGSLEYRRQMAGVLARRALESAWQQVSSAEINV